MTVVEVPSLHLAIVPGLLAVPLGFVVLLAFLEQAMRGIVMREVLGPLLITL